MAAEETLIIKPKVKIKVFGVGGGGNSVLMRMGRHKDLDIDLIAVNTDAKQLARVAEAGVETLQIGEDLTKGRGTGGNIALGEKAALDASEKIRDAMSGADLVFVTAGLGGGTGTGAAPVVAKIAHDLGTLSVGVVTQPFSFEGSRKKRLANEGLAKMQAQMDALILVANDNLMKLPENRHMTLVKAFSCADDILQQAINCIAELILTTGVINVDFADVTTIFRQSASSDALLGIGRSSRSAVEAVQQAVDSPLISKSLEGARGIILNLTGDKTLSLYDVDEATRYIYEHTDPEVNIILGTVIDNSLNGDVRATIIATDFMDGVMLKGTGAGRQEEKTQKPAAEQAAPQPKKDSFTLEPPRFMTQQAPAGNRPAAQTKPQGAFAIPAFRLAPDDKDEK
ncbi:cell division protein FtsZ [Mitsuokella sp.]|uniref:cell division protein FtsZ n=1 Tax=Mitsuokella sp. TaxID=2049034 RepID=UPI003D7EC88D